MIRSRSSNGPTMRSSSFFFAMLLIATLFGCSTGTVKSPLGQRTPSSDLEVSCLGPENAKSYVIYLHGIDSPAPSAQEVENRRILSDLAKQDDIRIALPRAKSACPTQFGSQCWGWKFDDAELTEILPQILNSRAACFAAEKPFKILGFSNGGYLLLHWYARGMRPSFGDVPDFLITSGSGKGYVPSDQTNLSSNPPLTLEIGRNDEFNFDSSEKFFHALKDLKAPVTLFEFEGGHNLNADALSKAFENAN
jgi:predicted esterase